MMSPLDTRIAFFGGAYNTSAIDAVIKLADAGFSVTVAASDPRESVLLRDAGLEFVDDRAAALEGRDVVITCLATAEKVEDLYMGDNGLLELMVPGTYAIDLSLSSPQLAKEIQAMAAISDIETLDAPIANLGEKGQPIVFIGGEKGAQDALSPLFPYFAPTVLPQAAPGDGQFAAMVSIIALAGSLMGAVEAMAFARHAGFSDSAAVNVLASTAGGSRALVDYIPRALAYDYNGPILVADFLDALEVALTTASALDMTSPMVETAYQLYELLVTVGGGELSIQALALLYEDEQTCADNGLDWALADSGDDAYDDMFESLGGQHGQPGCGGHRGNPFGGDDDLPLNGFFSQN